MRYKEHTDAENEMPFYTYHQNNSGGYYRGPAKYVIIEAADADTANYAVQKVGVYFDPEFVQDCPCCGIRWQPVTGDGDETPIIFGKSPENHYRTGWWKSQDGIRHSLTLYADGRREGLG